MQTIDFNLPADKGGGKVVGFNYSRSMGELIGTWSAEIANATKGALKAGDTFSMPCMDGGFIEKVWTSPDGMMHLTGKDAGVKLMRTTPPMESLSQGTSASAVISDLASFCGIDVRMSGTGLSGFQVRSAVTGTTCAEAILELALLSGCIAYINSAGKLVVAPPAASWTPPSPILDDSGSELDLDGYASQVTVVVTRRKKTIAEEDPETSKPHWMGETHDGRINEDTISGQFNYTDAEGETVSGDYSVIVLRPIDVIKESHTEITRDNVTITTDENHDYEINHTLVTRGEQEYRLFAWAETGYEIVKTTTGTYKNAKNADVLFTEKVTETMTRTFSIFNVPWIDEEWKVYFPRDLQMVASEKIERYVERDGTPPDANMPNYVPENGLEMRLWREYKRMDFGRGLLISEVETRYEVRQIGRISKIKKLNPSTGQYEDVTITIEGVWSGGRYIALTTHTTPVWVPVITVRTTYERYKDDGSCEISTSSEWCDEGAKWLLSNGLPSTGDEEVDKQQEEYAKFTQKASGLKASIEGSSAGSVWEFMEIPGRRRFYGSADNPNGLGVNSEDWYMNGSYVPSKICPHFDASNRQCEITGINAIGDFEGETCPKRGRNWRGCVRAKAALEQARSEDDRPLLEPPVVGIANSSGSGVLGGVGFSREPKPVAGYQREFYIDEIMTEGTAQSIAKQAAENILRVKNKKGLSKTIVIPYNPSVEPDGFVTSVSHDWANMQTTVTHRDSGYVPQFAIPSSVSGISDGISGRNSGRRTRPMSGTVQSIQNGIITVQINGMTYNCSTKLVNLGVGDAVLVSFSSGNSMHGHIIERM